MNELPDKANGRLVTGERLLELLFEEESRPNRQWLWRQTRKKRIPAAMKVAGRYYYDPPKVREALSGESSFSE